MEDISFLRNVFEKTDSLYIADGHHRTRLFRKGRRIRKLKKYLEQDVSPNQSNQPSTIEQEDDSQNSREFNRFLSVIFPDDELLILPL